MTYQVLARKWRPKRFADLVGQEHVVRALSNALKESRLHHAYLLTGTRGVGKTTIARILAKSLNCETGTTAEPCGVCQACTQIDAGRFVDLLEIDAASNTGIDNIREVLENAQYTPTMGRFKVYIIDEVHMLSKSAFNAMLKTLEEPPAHVKFILATTDPQKVPVTVLSRCLQFSLRNMTPQQVAGHLAHVLETEGVTFEAPALALLGRAAAGSMRDALSLLDQAIAYGVGDVREDGVRAMLGAVDQRYLFALLEALADADGARLIREVEALVARGIGFDSALAELALLLHQLALAQTVPDAIAADEPERDALFALAQRLDAEDVQLYYQIALHGRRDLALAPDEHAGFSMTMLRMLAFHPAQGGAEMAPRAVAHNRPAQGAPQPAASLAPTTASVSPARALLANIGGKPVATPSAAAEPLPAAETEPEPAPVAAPAVAVVATAPTVMVADEADAADTADDEMVELPATGDADGELADYALLQAEADAAPAPPAVVAFDGDWSALIGQLGAKMGAARMLAQNAALKQWDGEVFHLAVPEAFRNMAGRDFQEKLRTVLGEHLGRAVQISVSIETLDVETPAMRDARFKREQLAEARLIMQNDKVVQQLVQEMGATLLAETIQPVQE